jgi:hypothetical protein
MDAALILHAALCESIVDVVTKLAQSYILQYYNLFQLVEIDKDHFLPLHGCHVLLVVCTCLLVAFCSTLRKTLPVWILYNLAVSAGPNWL